MSLKDLNDNLNQLYYAAGTASARSTRLSPFGSNTPWSAIESEIIFNINNLTMKATQLSSHHVGDFYRHINELADEHDEVLLQCERIRTRLLDEVPNFNREYQKYLEILEDFLESARELNRCLHTVKDL